MAMEPNHGLAEQETDREKLTALTADLMSPDASKRLKAVIQMGELPTSNLQSLTALERRAARDPRKEVRVAALSALGSSTNQVLSSRRTNLPPTSRKLILKEIEEWVQEGVLPGPLAEVLRRRYAPPPKLPAGKPVKRATAPRPTLSQVILSETSIRIALFLGAFFVIAAAFIVAAVIESARLPILLLLTAGFFATGFGLKRRLPAASFILYAIFSVLLVIDAWVLSQGADLNADERLLFWTFVSLFMGAVWAVSTALYESRLFSVLAIAAATAAAILFGASGDLDIYTILLMVQTASALGLVVVYGLIRWRGTDFAVPVFTLIQFQIAGTLLFSVAMTLADPFLLVIEPTTWALISAIWLIGAVGYLASYQMFRLQLFQFLAMLALLPVPQLLAGVWSPEARTIFTISWVWGAVLAFAGGGLGLANWKDGKPYGPFLIGASVPLFAFAGLAWFLEDNVIGAAFLAGSALIYLGLMISRPREWIWIGSLSFALAAYLALLFGPGSDVDPGFALLLASLVFLTGWVVAEKWLTTSEAWHVAPLALGILTVVSAAGAFMLAGSLNEPAKAAIGLGILATYLYGLGAIRGTPELGFAASGLLAFSLLFTLIWYDAGMWVIPFVGLAAAFYLVGLLLRADEGFGNWSNVLRFSGLALGGIVGLIAPLEGGDSAILGVAVVASMFALEAALQRRVDLGYPAIFYYLITYIMVLMALDVTEPQAYSIGAALLGFVMHYLLVRAGSRDQAFVMGGLSVVVLLGTTYIQMLLTEEFSFFFVLFLQSLAVLAYGVVVRSRSLILAPILFSILGVVSVAFSVLAGVNTAILIGCTGLLMILLGVLAMIYRDRLLIAGQRLGGSCGGWLD
jgi:hypothetical protein